MKASTSSMIWPNRSRRICGGSHLAAVVVATLDAPDVLPHLLPLACRNHHRCYSTSAMLWSLSRAPVVLVHLPMSRRDRRNDLCQRIDLGLGFPDGVHRLRHLALADVPGRDVDGLVPLICLPRRSTSMALRCGGWPPSLSSCSCVSGFPSPPRNRPNAAAVALSML